MSSAGGSLALAGLLLSVPLLIAQGAAAGKERLTQASLPIWAREAVARAGTAVQAGAAVEILLEDALIEPLAEGGVRLTNRSARRVLATDGMNSVATFVFDHDMADEVVSAVAWNVLPDGSVRVPDPDDDVADLPWSGDGVSIDDARLRIVTVPGVVVGSVVVTESVVVSRLDVGATRILLGDRELPTAFARASVRVPAGWTVADDARNAQGLTREAGEGWITWSATNLPSPPREDPPAGIDVVLARLWFHWRSPDAARGFTDWSAVGRWYVDLTKDAAKEAGEAKAIAARLAPPEPAALAAALGRAFDFASREVRYVSIQLGRGGWSGYVPSSPGQVCTKRYGDCKAKSFLLRSLVAEWGLEAWPVLVRTKSIGDVVEAVPTPGQFNHCIVAVKLPDGVLPEAWSVIQAEGLGRFALLDATATYGTAWHLRSDDQGTLGLLCHGAGAALVRLPVQPPTASVTRREVDLQLDERGGLVKGTLREEWAGSAGQAVRQRAAAEDEATRRSALEARLNGKFPGAHLESHEVTGLEDPATSVTETTHVAGGRFGRRTMDLLMVEPASVSPGIVFGSLPPGARKSALDVGPPRTERLEIRLRVPAGWSPEALPAAFRLAHPLFAAEGRWEPSGDGLRYVREARLLADTVPPESYEGFRAMVLALRLEDARPVVFVEQGEPVPAPGESAPGESAPPTGGVPAPAPPPQP